VAKPKAKTSLSPEELARFHKAVARLAQAMADSPVLSRYRQRAAAMGKPYLLASDLDRYLDLHPSREDPDD
jgi:hypothetical protein